MEADLNASLQLILRKAGLCGQTVCSLYLIFLFGTRNKTEIKLK